jgi:hypothetical protein
MGIASANYEFTYIRFGTNGRTSDGGVIACIDFYEKLETKSLNIPQIQQDSNGTNLPYVFIGEEAFAFRECFLKLNCESVNERTNERTTYRQLQTITGSKSC